MDDREFFEFLSFRWDVTRAQQIARNLPVRAMDPVPWFTWLRAISVDEEMLESADLTRPLIVVKIRELNGAAMIKAGTGLRAGHFRTRTSNVGRRAEFTGRGPE